MGLFSKRQENNNSQNEESEVVEGLPSNATIIGHDENGIPIYEVNIPGLPRTKDYNMYGEHDLHHGGKKSWWR